jgi:aquaporin Z
VRDGYGITYALEQRMQTVDAIPVEPLAGDSIRRYVAELVGTFVLVLCGVGAAVLAGSVIGPLGVALAFGLALLAMVYAIGPISGCHINPAVTLGLWLSGKMERRHVAGYLGAQALGALLGAGVVLMIAHGMPDGYSATTGGLGANGYGDHSPGGFGVGAAFVLEVVLTMVLVLTVLLATDARAPVGFAGLAIGLALTLVHLVGIPVTNMSVNPARSLGPAAYVGGWALSQLWLFIVAPLLGAAAAAAIHRVLRVPAHERLTAVEGEQATVAERQQRVRREPVTTSP